MHRSRDHAPRDHIGLVDSGKLCKLSEYLMAHEWSWTLEVSVPGVAKHSARTLATLDGGNDNSWVRFPMRMLTGSVRLGLWGGLGASLKHSGTSSLAVVSCERQGQLSQGQRRPGLAQHGPLISTPMVPKAL